MLKTHYGETLLLILSLVMGLIMAVAVILLDGIALNISNIFKIWAMISLVIILVSIFLPYKDWSAAFCRRLGLKEGTLAWKLTDGIIPSLVLNTFNTAIVSGANIFYNEAIPASEQMDAIGPSPSLFLILQPLSRNTVGSWQRTSTQDIIEEESFMPIGFRAFLDIERPSPELIDAYREVPSSNIGDCVKRMNCMFGGIRSYNRINLIGPAFTVKVPAGDNLMAQVALDYAQPGDIIVIDGAVCRKRCGS